MFKCSNDPLANYINVKISFHIQLNQRSKLKYLITLPAPLLVCLQQREGVVVQVGEGIREAGLQVGRRVLILKLLLLLLLLRPLFLPLLLHGVNGVELPSIQFITSMTFRRILFMRIP